MKKIIVIYAIGFISFFIEHLSMQKIIGLSELLSVVSMIYVSIPLIIISLICSFIYLIRDIRNKNKLILFILILLSFMTTFILYQKDVYEDFFDYYTEGISIY